MKNYLLFLLLIINYNSIAQISNEGLLVYYPFDNDVLDYGQNEQNGIMFGGSFGEDQDGNLNSALYLNGISDFIDLSSFGELYRDNLAQMTVFFKIRFEKEESEQTILSLSSPGENLLTNVFEIEYENNGLQVESETGSSAINHELEIDQSQSVFTDQWHQILITLNEDSLTYCRDNEVIYQGIYTPTQTSCTSLSLGCYAGTSSSPCCFFGGYIDELQIYNRSLAKEEILLNTSNLLFSESIEFYPNPTLDNVFFKLGEQIEVFSVTTYDLLGKILKVEKFQDMNQFELKLPQQKGIYLVTISNQSVHSTFKLVKN